MSSNKTLYKDLIAFHPGSYVEDIVEDLNITQKEFAKRLDATPKSISRLINGEEKLSDELAMKLSKLTGMSLETWLNLQKKYDAKILEIKEKELEEEEEEICRQIDFKYFKNLKLVEDRRFKINEKIEFLRSLLNISSLTYLTKLNPGISFRNTSQFNDTSVINANILLEIASNLARNKTDTKLNKRKLERFLPEIKKMTLMDYQDFSGVLEEKLLECGVILVALPSLKNAQINGATKRFNNGSVLLMITDRNKDSDIFWFSLVHEIGHILSSDFYDNDLSNEEYQEKEKRADDFAKSFFIEDDAYESFLASKDFTKEALIAFSKESSIDPSILLGRLQKEDIVPYGTYEELKRRYSININ